MTYGVESRMGHCSRLKMKPNVSSLFLPVPSSVHPDETLCGDGLDLIALDLAIEGRATDPQHLLRHHFVAIYLIEDALDRHPFQVFKIGWVRGRPYRLSRRC